MNKNRLISYLLMVLSMLLTTTLTSQASAFKYSEKNHGVASFDVSLPVDSTGFTLKGKNIKGGSIDFSNEGEYLAHLLAYETGRFDLPTVTSTNNKPLIDTHIQYQAIKLINPNGAENLFIKVGTVKRTQKISGLDPHILKNGEYSWGGPFFSVGKENDTVKKHSENTQFVEVGSIDDPAKANAMYTAPFFLYLQGQGNSSIAAHPVKSSRVQAVLKKPYTEHPSCAVDGLWGTGDPYRKIKGDCKGTVITYPAGPDLDYLYGRFTLPSVYSPWTASAQDQCVLAGKKQFGCTDIKVASDIRFMAQKIRVPLNKQVSLFAEFGTVYRTLKPENLRYVCHSNVYLNGILPTKDCLIKSYLTGGWSGPYFSVGYQFHSKKGSRYTARYIYIPVKENANRLIWNDSSDTQLYAISASSIPGKSAPSSEEIKQHLNEALNSIRKIPAVYQVLGKHYFENILKKNKLR